jgi:hypothetical protein
VIERSAGGTPALAKIATFDLDGSRRRVGTVPFEPTLKPRDCDDCCNEPFDKPERAE